MTSIASAILVAVAVPVHAGGYAELSDVKDPSNQGGNGNCPSGYVHNDLNGDGYEQNGECWRGLVVRDGNAGIGVARPMTTLHVKQPWDNTTAGIRIESSFPNRYRTILMWGGGGANDGHLYFHSGSNIQQPETGNAAALTAAGTWADASDGVYKMDIADLHYGLDAILKLRPRRYKMRSDRSEQVGFIAQEVAVVVPEVVSGTPGYMVMSYGHLVPVLVKAIQEQQERIKQLQLLIKSPRAQAGE